MLNVVSPYLFNKHIFNYLRIEPYSRERFILFKRLKFQDEYNFLNIQCSSIATRRDLYANV